MDGGARRLRRPLPGPRHTNTFGYLIGEAVRPAAAAVCFGDLLAGWFADPRDADVFFGMPVPELDWCASIASG